MAAAFSESAPLQASRPAKEHDGHAADASAPEPHVPPPTHPNIIFADARTAPSRHVSPDQVLLRPLQPSDEATVLSIWLEGWEATLASVGPRAWAALTRYTLAVAMAALCCLLVIYAGPRLLRLRAESGAHQQPQPQQQAQWLAAGALPGRWLGLRHAAAALGEVASAVPFWGLACCSAAWVLWAAVAAAPLRSRTALLRRVMYGLVRRTCPDMWSLHRSWVRPAEGREYWVVELRGSGQVVGGVGIKVGAALRPLKAAAAPAAHPEGAAVVEDSVAAESRRKDGDRGNGGSTRGSPSGEPPENAAGFTPFEAKPHSSLDSRDALIFRMATDRSLRRCGIGRLLMEHVLARARAVGVRQVLLTTANTDAVAFYVACGFEARPEARPPSGGHVLWRAVST